MYPEYQVTKKTKETYGVWVLTWRTYNMYHAYMHVGAVFEGLDPYSRAPTTGVHRQSMCWVVARLRPTCAIKRPTIVVRKKKPHRPLPG